MREILTIPKGEKKPHHSLNQFKEEELAHCLRRKYFRLQYILRPEYLKVLWPQYVQGLFDTIFVRTYWIFKKKKPQAILFLWSVECYFTVVSAILGWIFSAVTFLFESKNGNPRSSDCYEKQRVTGVVAKVEYECVFLYSSVSRFGPE